MMEAVSSSETSVRIYHSTRYYCPEDRHLHTRRRQNLESCLNAVCPGMVVTPVVNSSDCGGCSNSRAVVAAVVAAVVIAVVVSSSSRVVVAAVITVVVSSSSQ
jgi:hypothetical protein